MKMLNGTSNVETIRRTKRDSVDNKARKDRKSRNVKTNYR